MRGRLTMLAAGAAVVVLTGSFLAVLLVSSGSSSLTRWVDDLGETAAALLAAGSCAFSARRHHGRGRVAWALLGASALSWGLGQVVWSWYELVQGTSVPFPSVADAGFLGAMPFAVAAASTFPGAWRRRASVAAGVLDGLIIATGLLAISWVTVLRTVHGAGGDTLLAQVLSLAYPINDVVVASMVLTLALRSTRETRGRYVLLIAGLVGTAIADSAFAYLTAAGHYSSGSPVDTGWVAGYLLVSLAALCAAGRPDSTSSVEPVHSRVRLALPYVPMAVATVMAVDEEISGRTLDPFLFTTLIVLVGLVAARQCLTNLDNIHLVRRLGTRERQLEHQAHHDALTGLPNRVLFRRRLEAALQRPALEGKVAVLFVDLDDFKEVNDTLGHTAGDTVLEAAAKRLRRCLRPGDVAARLGGDEFAVLVERVPRDDDVLAISERILDALREPTSVDGHTVSVRGTVGIAIVDPGHVSSDEVLRRADVAMYMGKNRGKGLFGVFEQGSDEAVGRGLDSRAELERAVRLREFALHYQPIVDIRTGGILAVEALLRWDHPERGLLLPAEFMSRLESSDLIRQVGAWVLVEACAQVASWRASGSPSLALCVNLSARQLLDPGLATTVSSALTAARLPAGALTLELTETAVAADLRASARALMALDRLGVRIALDDFGTGYSSIAHLRRFPVGILKVDRSFVSELSVRGEQPALAEALIQLGRTLGIAVVAEGVETQSQHEALLALGCRLAQGFRYARPVAATEMERLLSGEAVSP